MIDSGSGPNLIKEFAIAEDANIDREEILKLSGITAHRVTTLGLVKMDILGCMTPVHVVAHDFPIPQTGILGSDFLVQRRAVINYDSNQLEWDEGTLPFEIEDEITIPARSHSQIFVKVKNPEISVGYIPRIKIEDGIYGGEALVKVNKNNKAHLIVTNVNESDVRIAVPTIKLREIEEIKENISNNGEIRTRKCFAYKNDNDHKKLEMLKETEERAAKIKALLRLEHLNQEEISSVDDLIFENVDRFYLPGEKLGHSSVIEHRINTSDDKPINTRQYRLPPVHKEEIQRQVQDLIEGDIIKESESPYNSPVWIVPKKPDSQGNKRWRMVLDFRTLNEKTIGDAYPLPNITDILDQLGGAKYFSVFDLASGFHQIRMHPDDSHKTAFSTPYGHYEFNRMPFGLKNAPATFQRLMDRVLTGMQGNEIFVYLDDIVIYASSLTEHETKFRKLMDRLNAANLQLQPDKCEFLRREVKYLGHIIGENGVQPNPEKLVAVKNFPKPKSPRNIRQFLGLAGYYRRFIQNFSKIAKPLNDLLKKDTTFNWTDKQQNAFDELKDKLCSEPILQYPDFSKPFLVTTDASGYAIGAILSQGPVGKDLPISYASRVLNDAEKNYSTIEKELLAIVYAVNQFRSYVYGKKFILVTDHRPLLWIHRVKDPTSRLVRWRLKLAEYEYEIIHKAGKINVNADALSRNPVDLPEDFAYPVTTRSTARKEQRFSPYSGRPIEQSPSPSRELIRDKSVERSPSPSRNPATDKEPIIIKKRGRPPKGTQKETHRLPQREPIMTRNRTHQLRENRRFTPYGERPQDELSSSDSSDSELQSIDHETDDRTNNAEIIVQADVHREENQTTNNKSNNVENSVEENRPRHRKTSRIPYHLLQIADSLLRDRNNTPNEGGYLSSSSSDDDSIKLHSDSSSSESENEDGNLPIQEEVNQDRILTRNVKNQLINNRDRLDMRKDNYLYFLDRDGDPCDEGSRLLQKYNKLPKHTITGMEDVLTIKISGKYQFAVILKDLSGGNINHAFKTLRENIKENGIESISLAKSNKIGHVNWEKVIEKFQKALTGLSCKIIVCQGLVQVPNKERRKEIIEENHSSTIGGHKGMTKTYNRIRMQYKWKNMRKDIRDFVQHCLQCQLKKISRMKTKQPMVITDTPQAAFDKISMDIVGPLPKTTQGHEYILTVQDLLTKYSLAIPLKTISALSVAEAFTKRFICTFGAPKAILTDQGSNFTSKLMRRFAKFFHIKQYRTTAFHPQSNGSIERSHIVLTEFLRHFVDKYSEWDDLLEVASFSYNTSVHEGTNFTPFELIFGKLARLPSSEQIDDYEERTYNDYLTNLMTNIYDVQRIARENLIASKNKSKVYYDKKINSKSFHIGDRIFLLKEPVKGKFDDRYTGPYEVLDVLPDGNLKLFVKNKPRIVHPNKVKHARL